MSDWITITSDALTASINPLGAELSSLRDADGRELMTDADPAFWTGRAPILFPIVGGANADTIHIDGTAYPMKKHGFARHSMFTISEQREDRLVLSFDANTETRRSYPYEFSLRIVFEVGGAQLTVQAEIRNREHNRVLPASFGFHPAFAWPLPFGQRRVDHRIVFDTDEPDALPMLNTDGTIARERRASPLDGRTLHLADDLFAADALIWDHVRSQGVTYGASVGPQLRVDFPDTPMLGVWTKPASHFICIEPWHGIADAEGYTGDFRDKPGVFEVPPGGAKRIAMRVTLA